EIDNLALDLRANRELAFDIVPRIRHLLLETQAHAFLLAIDIENHHVDVLANLQHFRRMPNTAPAHVRDMQQAIDAVEIDERAEIRDVLDRALADIARGHL